MKDRPEEIERLGRALESGAGQAGGGDEPVPPGRIWDAVEGRLAPEEVADLAERAARDPELAADWRLAVAVQRERQAGTGGRVTAFPRRRWRGLVLAAAAALALVVAVPVIRQHLATREVQYRGEAGEAIRRLESAWTADGGMVLRWACTLPGARFDVLVSDEHLHTLAAAEALEGTSFTVPAPKLHGLAPGSQILWQVTAVTPDGRRIPSPTFIEHVPAPQP